MNAKHTPGPWTVDPKRRLRIFASDDQTVASAGGSDHVRDEWDANARLIAAAPDLLEALEPFAHFAEAVVRFAEGPGNYPKSGPIYALHGHGLDEREITVEHFRTALSAIAKARGEA